MNKVRKGRISHMDMDGGLGIIIDENGEDIPFDIQPGSAEVRLNMEVNFVIEFGEKGLRAVFCSDGLD